MTGITSSVVKVVHAADHVDLTIRYRLWSAVPTVERATEEVLRAHHDPDRSYYAEGRYRKDIALLRSPQCQVAIHRGDMPGAPWMPCRKLTVAGADLCPAHGGPSNNDSSRASLAAITRERDQLREQLDTLKELADAINTPEGEA